ncbi:restriction endonuclease [Anabaena sp. FACHB-1237]|uniref:restriction endonuclease n=1 Tax=Anabaena sp. FACHB-1237 TaxID=2692769 RepID=UPI001F550B00|nr:restriction endonuclease [Anabaena sp. FACHB-1237]
MRSPISGIGDLVKDLPQRYERCLIRNSDGFYFQCIYCYNISHWQIQCKNTAKVDIDVLAFVTGADVVMVVTTGEFTKDSYQYAYRMMDVSRYYTILLQKNDIESIKKDKTNIAQILDRKARRVFAKKELDTAVSVIMRYRC